MKLDRMPLAGLLGGAWTEKRLVTSHGNGWERRGGALVYTYCTGEWQIRSFDSRWQIFRRHNDYGVVWHSYRICGSLDKAKRWVEER